MSKRHKSEYRNQSLSNGLKVLRALLDAPSRGYSCRDIEKKSGVSYHQCYAALITLEIEGFARRFMGAWKPGDSLRVLAARTDLAFTRQDSDVMNLAESMRQSKMDSEISEFFREAFVDSK